MYNYYQNKKCVDKRIIYGIQSSESGIGVSLIKLKHIENLLKQLVRSDVRQAGCPPLEGIGIVESVLKKESFC